MNVVTKTIYPSILWLECSPRFASGLLRSQIVLISDRDPLPTRTLFVLCCCELRPHFGHRESRIWKPITVMQKIPPQHAMKRLSSRAVGSSGLSGVVTMGWGSVHSCVVDPGSSLVSVCQRSTFLPLFFRQSIQCCRVSPCEWHPKETPPENSTDNKESELPLSVHPLSC